MSYIQGLQAVNIFLAKHVLILLRYIAFNTKLSCGMDIAFYKLNYTHYLNERTHTSWDHYFTRFFNMN